MYETILYEKQDGIAIIKINRPEALNALNGQVIQDISDAVDAFARDDEAQVLVITGEGLLQLAQTLSI
jgi:enoyl-CoA hydratase/carnithine racemase